MITTWTMTFEEEAPRKGLFTKKGTEYEDEEESDKPRF